MRISSLFLLAAMCGVLATAQNAKVYKVSSEDARKGATLWAQAHAAQERFDDWRAEQVKKFTLYGTMLDFNEDFTVAVPHVEEPRPCGNISGSTILTPTLGGLYATPLRENGSLKP